MTLKFSPPKQNPPKIIIYGTQGVGKTTIAANFPKPVFVRTEDGMAGIQADATPLCETYDQFSKYISDLASQEHDYKTVVIDSLDWMERLLHHQIAQSFNVFDIGQINYGKGYTFAEAKINKLIKDLDELSHKGIIVLGLAHAEIKRFEPPDSDPYDRYAMKLEKRAERIFREWCDILAFIKYDVTVVRTEGKFGATKTKAQGDGERVMHFTEKPAYLAKNRYKLPEAMDIGENESELVWQKLRSMIKGE